MRIGIPTEIKNNEYRVAATPAGVAELTHRGHEVVVEAGAGLGSRSPTTTSRRPGRRSSRPPTRSGIRPR